MEIWLLGALTLSACITAHRFLSPRGSEGDECLHGGGVMSEERGGCLVEREVEEGKPFLSKRKQIKGLLLVPLFPR